MKKLTYGQQHLFLAKSNCVLLKSGKLERKINSIFFVDFCFVLLRLIRAFMQQGIKKSSLATFENHVEPAYKACSSNSRLPLTKSKTSLIEKRGVMNHHLEVAAQMTFLPPYSK